MKNKLYGFTLIELLVVIAIIGIIAAILFPVFAKVREKGRQTSCVSNLRQLGLAFSQYEQDNDDQLPGAYDGPSGVGQEGGWMYYDAFLFTNPVKNAFDPSLGSIFPYVKNKQVYVCPSDGVGQTDGNSYAINSCVEGKPDADTSLRPGKMLAQFDNTSGIMLLAEEDNPGLGSTNDAFLNLNFTGGFDYFSDRHNGVVNVLFIDNHVKSYQTSRVHVLGLQTGIPNEVPGVTNCP